MMKALVLISTLALVVSPSLLIAAPTDQSRSVNVKQMVLSVSGMSCSGCAIGIKAMLKRTAGVLSAEVSYDDAQAKVEYDGAKITEKQIIEVISKMGYKAAVKKS